MLFSNKMLFLRLRDFLTSLKKNTIINKISIANGNKNKFLNEIPQNRFFSFY